MIGEFAVVLPLILWLGFRLLLPAGPYEFDFDAHVRGTFISLLPYYLRFFWVAALVSLAGAVTDWLMHFEWTALLFLMAAIYAFVFNGLLIFFYESYLHSRYPRGGHLSASSYTLGRYSLILSLGISSVGLLLAAVAWTAWLVA